MSVLGLVPEKVLQPSRLEDYQKKMRVFSDELVYLHTNLSLLRQISDFDFSLFEAPVALFRYIGLNLMSECVLIVARLWGDKRKDVLTLDKFGAWLPSAVRCRYKDDVQESLKVAHPSREVEDLIHTLRTIRHAELAHLSRDVKLGFKTRPAAIKLAEIQKVATCLGGYYNSVNFGAEMMFVLAQLEAPGGKYHESQLGYVFDRIALGSKWFRTFQDYPELWPEYKAKLSGEQLAALNEVAARQRQTILV